MFKILGFFKSNGSDQKLCSMRERFDALQIELNAVLCEMPEMPNVTVNAAERRIDIAAPEQFIDEARALPAPSTTDISAA